MEIVFHLGVHLTDEDLIQRTLLKNRDALAREGIAVPLPRRFRPMLRQAVNRPAEELAGAAVQDGLLRDLVDTKASRRVVFCNENFLSLKPFALGRAGFYPMAAEKAGRLRALFPDHAAEFFLAVRNPAAFLPELHAALKPEDRAPLLAKVDPRALRWSDTVARLRAGLPDCPITVWCHEDLPVRWPEVLRALSGHAPDTALAHLEDLWGQLLEPEGMARMQAYFADHPPATDARRRRAVAAFLEKFGRTDRIEMEIDLPGWTVDLVEEMGRAYEADLAAIAAMPGVRLLG